MGKFTTISISKILASEIEKLVVANDLDRNSKNKVIWLAIKLLKKGDRRGKKE